MSQEASVDKFLPIEIFDLIYSMPGEGKSEAAKAAAKQALKENPGKIVKLIIADGSAATYAALIKSGKARLIEVSARPWPMTTLAQLCAGWDLKDPNNPLSELIPPTPDGLKQYCMTIFEGATVLAAYVMGNVKGGMAYRAANGEQLGPDPVVVIRDGEYDAKGKLTEGSGMAFGTNGTAHYMATQGNFTEFVNQSRSLPGHKIWTAHEVIMEESVNIGDLKNQVKVRKGTVLGGPSVAGKALTPTFQKSFNNTLHSQTIAKQVKGEKADDLGVQQLNDNDITYVLWTRDHFAQTGAMNVKYKGCTRNVPEDFPAYFVGEKRGENILAYYRALHLEMLKEMEEL
jgi:hypothetical protein